MREILFRAKRIDNGEWVEGSFIDSGNHEQVFIYPHYDGASTMPCRSLVYHRMIAVDPDTICQYTGLTDKNGNKIWENDVIATDCGNARVIYSNDPSPYENSFYVGFEIVFENIIDNENYRHDLGYWTKFRGFEVIGNIFDNADLLKGE